MIHTSLKSGMVFIAGIISLLLVLHCHVACGARFGERDIVADSQRHDTPYSSAWFPGRVIKPPRSSNRKRAAVSSSTAAVSDASSSTAAVSDASSLSDGQLVQVAFIHRHGARTAPSVIHGKLSWDWCHLSTQGVTMAIELGHFIRARYGDTFLGTIYNREQFVTRSTDYERTIRTAYGVVSGVYPRWTPGNNYSLPYVYHPPMSADPMLSFYYSWGAALLHQHTLLSYPAISASQTVTYFPWSDLQMLAGIIDALPECQVPGNATTCALLVEDVTTCMYSNDPVVNQTLLDYLTDDYLLKAQSQSFRFLYSMNYSSPYSAAIGPYAMRFLTQVIEDFRLALSSSAGAGGGGVPAVYHYSAHDNTLFGLFVAMGAIVSNTSDIEVLVPRFTSTVFFELYSNGSVSVAYAVCEQRFGTYHNFTTDPRLQLRCLSNEGQVYTASNCPLNEWASFIATLNTSQVDDPICYATPNDVALTQCEPWGNTSIDDVGTNSSYAADVRTLKGFCIQYRQYCPDVACNTTLVLPPTGLPEWLPQEAVFTLNRSSWSCVRVVPSAVIPEPPPSTALVATFLGLGSFSAAALIVIAVVDCFGLRRRVALALGAGPETADLIGGEERNRASLYRTDAGEPLSGGQEEEATDLYQDDSERK